MTFTKLALLALSALAAPTSTLPLEVNRLVLSKVAYANVVDQSLYFSTFDGTPIVGKDYTYVMNNAADLANGVKALAPPVKLAGSVTWPNMVQKAPASLFGVPGVIISGGFLVPGKTNGGLWFSSVANNQNGPQIELFKAKGYFYHEVAFYDVNQDGLVDILTCRATKPLFGAGKGDLTWLEPIDRTKPLGKWKETVIGKGCDTFFKLVDIDNDGHMDIVAGEFWGSAVSITKSDKGKFSVAANNKYIVVDNKVGRVFEMQVTDVNGDGIKDLLVTNHEEIGDNGAVYAFEIPADINGKWIRHELVKGFPVLQGGPGQASPGGAQTFYAGVEEVGKPSIVLAGDASQKAYIMSPNSANTADWTFTTTVLHDCKCTVGGIAVADLNRDSKTEIYIPCYDDGYLAVYSF